MVDGRQHRIIAYDRAGGFLQAGRGGRKGLAFPNTALVTPAGDLVVADTNHHRLVALDPETLGVERWELAVENRLGNFRRIWPTDVIVAPDGYYWVIIDNDKLENGDVILFSDLHSPFRRLDLPADWDPIRLRVHGDSVLLASHGSVDLVRVSLDGMQITPFGNEALRADLAGVRARRLANGRWWELWIWILITPLGLLAGVAAFLDHRRRRRAQPRLNPAAEPQPLPGTADGIYWIEHNPVVIKQWQLARWGMYLPPALMLLTVAVFTFAAGCGAVVFLTGLTLAGLVALTAWMVVSLRIISSGHLGVTPERLVLADRRRKPQHAYPRQLVYTQRFISSGATTVFTRTARAAIFEEAAMRDYVQPLLAQARRLNAIQGYVYLLQAGDRYTWINTVAIACMTGWYLYMEFFL